MKILITADCYTPTINGVVTSILNLETELRRLGHDVKILCPSENFHSSESENVCRSRQDLQRSKSGLTYQSEPSAKAD